MYTPRLCMTADWYQKSGHIKTRIACTVYGHAFFSGIATKHEWLTATDIICNFKP